MTKALQQEQMPVRSSRVRIKNELGQAQTLASGPEQFLGFGQGKHLLLLGLGPDPHVLTGLIPEDQDVYYLEAPGFLSQMPPTWRTRIPSAWRDLRLEEINLNLVTRGRVLFYRRNLRLFPSFWGPIWAKCEWLRLHPQKTQQSKKAIWIPAKVEDLLVPELTHAFREIGFEVSHLPPSRMHEFLLKHLAQVHPQVLLSINFSGLDPYGECFYLLKQADVPVVVWCVDNPFHLLTGLKSSFWKEVWLMVTDPWFIEPLRQHGARRVLYLPLAACPEVFQPSSSSHEHDLKGRLVFVGRSEFPRKEGFFSACKLPHPVWEDAKKMLDQGRRPDFSWWQKRLGNDSLWPGQQVRQVGFGAEQSSRAWRTLCLKEAAKHLPLTVFGDSNWSNLLPESAEIWGEVDYYGPLAGIYGQAEYTLNTTSLLLPRGLTQRHFDVWAAGGFLITDATPGLELFPEELAGEISFDHPRHVSSVLNNLERDSSLRSDLQQAWRKLILTSHTYRQRVETIMDWVE